MKKFLIAVIFSIAAVFGCLFVSACSDDPPEGAYYGVTVTGIDDLLCEPLKDKYQAGTEIEVKLNVITDVSLFVFVNDIRVGQSHYDSDYWGYKFTMPGEDIVIYITSDAYHGVEICDFDEVFYWAADLSPEKIVKIKCEEGYAGVSPDIQPDTKYITDKTEIENVYAIFNRKLKPCENPQLDGGYYITYTFYTAETEYELEISNGFVIYKTFSSINFFEVTDPE